MQPWHTLPDLELVCCSMSSSNCCFLTCIHVLQEAGKVVWYSHLFQNFPLFVVIHTVKGFGIINKAEINVFLEFYCFFDDPADAGNLISGSPAFSKSSLNIWKFLVPEVSSSFLLAWKISAQKSTDNLIRVSFYEFFPLLLSKFSLWL